MRWLIAVLMVACLACPALAEGSGWSLGVLTNETTDQLEGRLGVPVGEQWEVGVLARWFTEDVAGTDWGVGGFVKMAVDPNSTIAVNDWLPAGLGDLLALPETLNVETYAIGKLLYADTPDGDPFSAAIGAGFQAGPATVEVLYNVVETGVADDPLQRSGVELWFGATLEF